MLALWAAFGVYARAKVPLPEEIIDRLVKIAGKVLKYAANEVPRGRHWCSTVELHRSGGSRNA